MGRMQKCRVGEKTKTLQFWPLMKRPASIFQEWTHVITHSPPGLIRGAEVFWGDGWNLVKKDLAKYWHFVLVKEMPLHHNCCCVSKILHADLNI